MADVTEKQSTFIDSLLEQRAVPEAYLEKFKELRPNLDRQAASLVIEQLLGMPKKQQQWIVPDKIPDGRYAVIGNDGHVKFFRVVTRNPDTPQAKRYCQKVLGSPGDFWYVRVTAQEWKLAVTKISEDPATLSIMFGLEVGACGVCGSPLTDPESIALGIGPICARKWGGLLLGDDDDD